MRNQIFESYLSAYIESGRSPKSRKREIKNFLSYVSSEHDGLFNYETVQKWKIKRLKTRSKNGVSIAHNYVADFADWARLFDTSIGEIPRCRHIPSNRRKPYIFDVSQVRSIMKTQRAERSLKDINPYTYSTITGLLFTTGLRIGEAVNLTDDDVDLEERTIYVPPGKGARDRIIPISVSTAKVLKAYTEWRETVREDARNFLIFDNPKVRFPDNIYRESFNVTTEKMGLRTKMPSSRGWRNITVHDLRHTFAVKALLKAYESDVDIHEAAVQLSSVMGHEDVKYTYWYIEQVPELIAAAFERVSS